MNPRAVQIAMEQMRRMSPEQLNQIQGQMGNISPEMMRTAMNQMQNMSDRDWDNVGEKLQGMDPSSMSDQMSSRQQAQQEYALKASLQLKNEGNGLHKAGNYSGAIEKYRRARDNLSSSLTQQAKDISKACGLNLASCYLMTNNFQQCVEECNGILQQDGNNVKALYRRGQGYKGLQRFSDARGDLSRAHDLSAGDVQQQAAIRDKLKEVEKVLESEGVDGLVEEVETKPVRVKERYEPRPGFIIEEITDENEEPASPSTPLVDTPTTGADPTSAKYNQTAKMMKDNPDMVKHAAEMMSKMSDEDLAALGRGSGMDISADMMRDVHKAMANMDSDSIQQMAQMAQNMPNWSDRVSSGSHAGPRDSTFPNIGKVDPQKAEEMAKMFEDNPDLAKQRAEMLASMSQDELDRIAAMSGLPANMRLTPELAKQAAASVSNMDPDELKGFARAAKMTAFEPSQCSQHVGGSAHTNSTASGDALTAPEMAPPPGMAFTPDMMKAATEMMSKMSPEDMANMAKMAGDMQQGGGASGRPTPGSLGDFPDNPEMFKSMMKMMQGMDEGALADMCVSMGMCKDKEQAKQAAKQMKQMTPGQMEMMAKAAGVVQKGAKAVKKTKEFLMGKTALILAFVVLIVGLIWRYFDRM